MHEVFPVKISSTGYTHTHVRERAQVRPSRRERVEGRASNLSPLKGARIERERRRAAALLYAAADTASGPMRVPIAVHGPPSYAKKRGTKASTRAVGVDGSERRERRNGCYAAFFSRAARTRLGVRDAQRGVSRLPMRRRKRGGKRRDCSRWCNKSGDEGRAGRRINCREDKCHRDRPLIYYGGSE